MRGGGVYDVPWFQPQQLDLAGLRVRQAGVGSEPELHICCLHGDACRGWLAGFPCLELWREVGARDVHVGAVGFLMVLKPRDGERPPRWGRERLTCY